VFIDELPRNPTGKVLKRELAEHGEEGESSDKPQKSNGKAKARSSSKKASAEASSQ
jgi:hypothetical protein